MRYCLFSDLHADSVGLEKLLQSADFKTADKRVCLGDVINAHQPESAKEYWQKVRAVSDDVILGNHEAVLAGLCTVDVFGPHVRDAISQSIAGLSETDPGLLQEFRTLPKQVQIDGATLRHASADPENPWKHIRYIEDVQHEALFLEPGSVNIVAHGHIPFIAWTLDGLWYYQRQIYGTAFRLAEGTTYVVNAGSVLGSREMRHQERTVVTYDSDARLVEFNNLEEV